MSALRTTLCFLAGLGFPGGLLALPSNALPEDLRIFAVAEARKQGLADLPAVKDAEQQALLEVYVERLKQENTSALEASPAEIEAAYRRSPLVRLHHLMLKPGSPHKAEVLARLKKKTSFDSLVREFSEDESAPFAGDTDFRGAHQLPMIFYQAALRLKLGEIAGPLQPEGPKGSNHWIQLVATRSFTDAHAPYLYFLQNQLEEVKLQAFLRKRLKNAPHPLP